MIRFSAAVCQLLIMHLAFASGRALYQGGPPPISAINIDSAATPLNIVPPPGCNCTDVPPPPPAGSGGCLNLDISERCNAANTAADRCEISCARCLCCLSIIATAERAGLTAFTQAMHSLLLASERQGGTAIVPPSLWSAFTLPGANKTVFAPTNAAFAALAAELGLGWAGLLQQPHLLDRILQYGVLAGSIVVDAQELASGQLGSSIRTQLDPELLTVLPSGCAVCLLIDGENK